MVTIYHLYSASPESSLTCVMVFKKNPLLIWGSKNRISLFYIVLYDVKSLNSWSEGISFSPWSATRCHTWSQCSFVFVALCCFSHLPVDLVRKYIRHLSVGLRKAVALISRMQATPFTGLMDTRGRSGWPFPWERVHRINLFCHTGVLIIAESLIPRNKQHFSSASRNSPATS